MAAAAVGSYTTEQNKVQEVQQYKFQKVGNFGAGNSFPADSRFRKEWNRAIPQTISLPTHLIPFTPGARESGPSDNKTKAINLYY